jgi:YidC/Oxa1 family membrane protein insertase
MSSIYHALFFNPLYNIFVSLNHFLPWADVGLIVVLLTFLVRLALYPISRKAIVTQIRMNEIAPELEKLKEKHKNDTEAQARATMALYREKGVNPFSSILLLLIQLPVIFALYRIFLNLSEIQTNLLYPFVAAPAKFDTLFLGLIDVSGQSLLLALLAALSTYFQISVAASARPVPTKGASSTDNLSRNMQNQMKYFMPVMVFFISYKIAAVAALYWLATNLFTIGQELILRRRLKPAV